MRLSGLTSDFILLPNFKPCCDESTARPWSPIVPDNMILSPTARLESSAQRVLSSRYFLTTCKLLSREGVLLPIPETFIRQPPKLPFSTTFVSPVTTPTHASMQACLM